jgi:hypothetical protein
MTIIAFRYGALAGDTQTNISGSIYPYKVSKVFKISPTRLIGFVGEAGLGHRFLRHFLEAQVEPRWLFDKAPKMPGSKAIIFDAFSTDETAVSIFEDDTWFTTKLPYDLGVAYGSGMDFALGAMFQGADATEAATAARYLDVGCGGDIETLYFGEDDFDAT